MSEKPKKKRGTMGRIWDRFKKPPTGGDASPRSPRTPTEAKPANASDGPVTPESLLPDLDHPISKKDLLTTPPTFKDFPPAERPKLMIRKLQLCSVVFHFADDGRQESLEEHTQTNIGKEVKRQLLLELVDYISTSKSWFSEQVLVEIISMVRANLFRSLPASPNYVFDPEEDDPVLDPAWPHLQLVYEFLLRFIVSSETDTKTMKKYVNGAFVLQILDLFDSEDPRERDYLKTILHRIYGKFMSLRAFIRKSINNVFFKFIYESHKHPGVGELLEILGSIINGFALPLKLEHRKFLRNVLIPLHKVKTLSVFHQQLAYCVTQFIDKDPKLASVVIGGILKFWPQTSSAKEVLFLNELEEVLELTQADEFEAMTVPLFKQIARSIHSPHFQVAERALFLWNNEYIASLTTDHRAHVLPLLYAALHQNSKHHWNQTVHSLTFNIIKMFMDADQELFERCNRDYEVSYKDPKQLQEDRNDRWAALLQQARDSARVRGITAAPQVFDFGVRLAVLEQAERQLDGIPEEPVDAVDTADAIEEGQEDEPAPAEEDEEPQQAADAAAAAAEPAAAPAAAPEDASEQTDGEAGAAPEKVEAEEAEASGSQQDAAADGSAEPPVAAAAAADDAEAVVAGSSPDEAQES